MIEPDIVIFSTFAVLAVVVGVGSWWAFRLARQAERESRALTAEQLRIAVQARKLPGPLMWGVWLGVNSISERRLILRDVTGTLVTEIHYVPLPLEGVIRHFAFEGKRYEYIKEAPFSGRMWLREASSGEVVLSCRHGVWYRTIFCGTSDTEIVRVHNPNVFSEIGKLTHKGEKIGQLSYERKLHARVLSLQRPSLTLLEQCFVMLSAG